MDIADWLAAITDKCHLVRSPDQAIRLAPDLCVDAPSLWDLGVEGANMGGRWVYPVACTSRLSTPVAEVVAKSLAAALDDQERESFARHGVEQWAADPLVSTLARLFIEAAAVSSTATGTPLLELARISTGLLAGDPAAGIGRSPAVAAIERSLITFAGLEASRRGEVLAQVAWSLSARTSAAWGIAAQLVPSIRPTRFFQALLRSKLSLVVRSTAEIPEMALMLGALGVPADASLVTSLMTVCEKGLAELEERLQNGSSRPADRHFAAAILARAAVPQGADRRHWLLAHDPDVATGYLLRLADFQSVKQLDKLGIDRKRAKQLLDPELAQAVAASMHDVLEALQLWDFLGGMVSLVRRTEDIEAPSWKKGALSRLVVPRGDLGDTKVHVVAARLGDIQARTFQDARTNDEPLIPLALDRLVSDLVQELRAGGHAVYNTGSHLVCALPSASAALSVAQRIAEALTPPKTLALSPLRQPSSLPRGPAVGIGMSYGSVHGGFDGTSYALRGAPVEQAIGLTGLDAPHGALGDPLGVRNVALGAAGLLSKGLVASPGFVEQLQAEHQRRGQGFLLPDHNQPVAGVRKPFVAYPVVGVSEASDRTVVVLLRLDGDEKDSPVEIAHMGIDAFQEFHAHEQGLAPGACRGIAGGNAAYGGPHRATQPPATSSGGSGHSDPFSSLSAAEPDAGGFDFESEDDEEYEFEIEDVPHTPAPVEQSADDSDIFGDLEVEDFDEGVLLLEDGASLSPEVDPLGSLGEEGLDLGEEPDASAPFSFESDGAFSSDAEDVFSSDTDDLFSFDDSELDEDPFAEPAPAASVSLSGESSLDAWSSTPPNADFPDPSAAGARADDDAPLGFLPPADLGTSKGEHALDEANDEPIPLGFLPPAPNDQAETEVHEFERPRRDERPVPAANPTLMPEDIGQKRPAAPGHRQHGGETEKPRALPSMPASLLALIGDDEREPSEEPMPGSSATFQFVASNPEPAAEPPVSRAEPRGAEAEPAPTADPWRSAFMGTPEPEDDPFAESTGASAELSMEDAFAGEREDDEDPFAPIEEPIDQPRPTARARPEPSIDLGDLGEEDDLGSDPLGGDDEAFESLFEIEEGEQADDALFSQASASVQGDDWDQDDLPEDEPVAEPAQDAGSDQPSPFDLGPEPFEDESSEFLDEPSPFDGPRGSHEPPADAFDDEPLEDPFDLGEPPATVEDAFDPSFDEPEEPEEPVVEQPAPAKPGRGADGAKRVGSGKRSRTLPDFSFMFTGYYIYITDKNSVLFGHRHGSHLLDVHEYPCGDDVPEAYQRFLKDKISERFVPRADLSRPVPKSIEGRPLDAALLQQAFTNLDES